MSLVESPFHLKNRVAVITGGNGVPAGAIARGLADAGAKVVLIGTSEERVERAARALSAETMGLVCNVVDEEQVRATNRRLLDEHPGIDILINAAGGNTPGATVPLDRSVIDIDFAMFGKVADLNFL